MLLRGIEELKSLFLQTTQKMSSSRRADQPTASKSMAEKPSHFFKIILAATLQDKKLLIPDKFVRKFRYELSNVALLRVPNARVWHVRLTKDGKKIWFSDGWHEFVNYHSISVGYFLLFKYERNSTFQVIIFDKSTCEIRYPYYYGGLQDNEPTIIPKEEVKMENSPDMSGSQSQQHPHFSSLVNKICKIEGLDDINTPKAITAGDESQFKMVAVKAPDCSSDEEYENLDQGGRHMVAFLEDMGITTSWKFIHLTAEEKQRVFKVIRLSKPKNPAFMTILRPDNIHRSRVTVPSKFARQYLSSGRRYIKVCRADGREFSVQTIWYGRSCIMSKIRVFSKKLAVGDVCLFEVIRKKKLLKFSVVRAGH